MYPEIKNLTCRASYSDSPDWETLEIEAPKVLATDVPTVSGIFGGQSYVGDTTELLRCNISSKSPVRIQWYADHEVVQESDDLVQSCFRGGCKNVISILNISVSENVTVNYTCTATNFKGKDSKTHIHQLRDIVSPYIIGESEETHEFYVGDLNKELNCTVLGEPRPNRIYWKKDSDDEQDLPDVVVEFDDSNTDSVSMVSSSIYNFSAIGLNSAGTYVCIGANRFSHEVKKTFNVKVSKSPFTRNIIISSVAGLVLIGIIFGVLLRKYKRENKELIKFEKQFRVGILSDSKAEKEKIRPLSLPYIQEFEIERAEWQPEYCIGGGEFGEVWCGTLRRSQSMHSSDEPVAIKFLKPDGRQIPLLKVLCSELKMMMRIKQLGSDPNIVNFIGATTKNFQKMEVYLIMELCSLGSLKSYVSINRNSLLITLDLITTARPEVAKWSSEIASGMLFLSMHQIVHIDLAARNIFLTADKVAKVGDYGLSRSLYDKGFYKQKQSPFRPELWTALESLRDDIFTVQSDVWSYGVTIWEIFSMGADPVYSQIDIVAALEYGERLDKPTFATENTYQLLRRCWERVPESRPDFFTLVNYFKILQLQVELDVRVDGMSRAAIIEETETPKPTIETYAEFTETRDQTTNPVNEAINAGFTERYLNPFETNVPMPLVSLSNPEILALETTGYLKFDETEGFSKIVHESHAEFMEMDNQTTNSVTEANTRFTEKKFKRYQSNFAVLPPVPLSCPEDPALEVTRYLKFEEAGLPKVDQTSEVTILISKF